MAINSIDQKEQIQEEQYEYPYHYIPNLNRGFFSQTHYWSWGFRYLGGLQVVFQLLDSKKIDSLVDIGCGDGRFLNEVKKSYPYHKLTGVDYSQRAVQLAKALNPGIKFLQLDITEDSIQDSFETATVIEVLEHIPPDNIGKFIKSVCKILVPKGTLVLTVPHKNKNLNPKHYQHFSSKDLINLLSPYFSNFQIVPFDPFSRVMQILQLAIGGMGQHYIINNKKILRLFYNYYKKNYLYCDDEKRCGRIAVTCEKISR